MLTEVEHLDQPRLPPGLSTPWPLPNSVLKVAESSQACSNAETGERSEAEGYPRLFMKSLRPWDTADCQNKPLLGEVRFSGVCT